MASPKKNAANTNKTSWGRILGAVAVPVDKTTIDVEAKKL